MFEIATCVCEKCVVKFNIILITAKCRKFHYTFLTSLIRPQKIDLLFLRHFFEETNARGRNFFLLCQITFSCFSVDSNVKDSVIAYTLL